MSFMFSGAKSFNQPLNKWDVSSVNDMSSMFDEAKSFNQSLTDWNISSAINKKFMFNKATSFNKNNSPFHIFLEEKYCKYNENETDECNIS